MKYNLDSIDKIEGYLTELDKDALMILPSFFQKYSCPFNCGGCCLNFTKDFLPDEFEEFQKLYPQEAVLFKKRIKNGLEFYTYTESTSSLRCKFFKGKCTIHELNPFSCFFELNKVRILDPVQFKGTYTQLGKCHYRDRENMKTVQGTPILCSFSIYTEEQKVEDIKALERLQKFYTYCRQKKNLNLESAIEFLKRLDLTKGIPEKSIVIVKGEIEK